MVKGFPRLTCVADRSRLSELAYQCALKGIELGGVYLQSPIASAVRVVVQTRWPTLPIDVFTNWCAVIESIADVWCLVTKLVISCVAFRYCMAKKMKLYV
jgi:hypothetical protein